MDTKGNGIEPKWYRLIEALHDFVLSGSRVTYMPVSAVTSWLRSTELMVMQRQAVYLFCYRYEKAMFTKRGMPHYFSQLWVF